MSEAAVAVARAALADLDALVPRIWLLNDIFVDPATRRTGAGAALMEAVEAFARETGAGRLDLFTARTNLTAQSVYKRAGWIEDAAFLRFQKKL